MLHWPTAQETWATASAQSERHSPLTTIPGHSLRVKQDGEEEAGWGEAFLIPISLPPLLRTSGDKFVFSFYLMFRAPTKIGII